MGGYGLAVSRRPRPSDCFAGYNAIPIARCCHCASRLGIKSLGRGAIEACRWYDPAGTEPPCRSKVPFKTTKYSSAAIMRFNQRLLNGMKAVRQEEVLRIIIRDSCIAGYFESLPWIDSLGLIDGCASPPRLFSPLLFRFLEHS